MRRPESAQRVAGTKINCRDGSESKHLRGYPSTSILLQTLIYRQTGTSRLFDRKECALPHVHAKFAGGDLAGADDGDQGRPPGWRCAAIVAIAGSGIVAPAMMSLGRGSLSPVTVSINEVLISQREFVQAPEWESSIQPRIWRWRWAARSAVVRTPRRARALQTCALRGSRAATEVAPIRRQ